MGRVDGFWMGALQLYRRVDFPRLAAQAGGWAALMALGRSELTTLGLTEQAARVLTDGEEYRSEWSVMVLDDPDYPDHLYETPFPPPVLFFQGDPSCLERPGVSIVGTRRCTPYGAGVAARLGEGLASGGRVVISGMARGIDQYAHEGASRSGRTVAVLGEGLSRSLRGYRGALRQMIVRTGGLILSSWPDAFEAKRWTFPLRNRWIAALGQEVVVVEAPERSGALITARYAVELGRDVYGVPAQLNAPMSRGVLNLLRDGAHPIVDLEDFISDRSAAERYEPVFWLERILLGETPDVVARTMGWSIIELLVELSTLEAEGRVVKLATGGYGPGRRVQ